MNDLTFEDLRPHFGTGRAYVISGTGRDRVYGYRTGIRCNAGDIEVSEWREKVKELIESHGEQELFRQLLTHLKETNYTKASKAVLEQETLELHASRIFDNPLWVDFVPFNQRFRPEVLQTVKLIPVMPECCKKEGFITEASHLERTSAEGKNYCPHCGRWTMMKVQKEEYCHVV